MRQTTTRALLAALALLVAAPPAVAQDVGDEACPGEAVGCSRSEAEWSWRHGLFDDVELDTGWVPRSGPVQLRFGLFLGGSTEVDLAGDVVAAWPPAMTVSLEGTPSAGRLAINYGIELTAMLRFDVEVAGIRYTWEGDIPVPFVPEDLRMAGQTIFDPFVLPGDDPRPVTVEDSTDRVRVLAYDALSGIIDIPGVGGGVLLALQGRLAAAYRSDRVEVLGADPIELEGGSTVAGPDPDATGWGTSTTVTLHPEGRLDYDGELLLLPSLYIEVVGTRFDYPIAEIAVPLVRSGSNVVFDDLDVHLPLPELEYAPAQLTFRPTAVGESIDSVVTFWNLGEAPLVVRPVPAPAPFAVDPTPVVVSLGSPTRVAVRFAPVSPGQAAAMVAFETNDPDEPEVLVMLLGEGVEPVEEPDAGPEADGDAELELEAPRQAGCACRATGPGSGSLAPLPVLAILLGVLVARPRRP